MTALELAPPVVELRQYLLHGGRRDELVALFDREFIEAQEAVGIRVVGQFRDIDRVNHFVWLRGFVNHDARREALGAFYRGPVWRRHAAAANATMIDSSDVLQLRAVTEAERLSIRKPGDRDGIDKRGSILIVVSHRGVRDPRNHDRLMRDQLAPRLEEAGLRTIGVYETDFTENPFPELPVRSANVLVWLAAGEDIAALDEAASQLSVVRAELACDSQDNGRDELLLDVLRLQPTARSCLTGRSSSDASQSKTHFHAGG